MLNNHVIEFPQVDKSFYQKRIPFRKLANTETIRRDLSTKLVDRVVIFLFLQLQIIVPNSLPVTKNAISLIAKYREFDGIEKKKHDAIRVSNLDIKEGGCYLELPKSQCLCPCRSEGSFNL